ncbi:MAG: hypothetical protein GWO24_28090, partial [Akkermansiaceae bacterium]|nr:hypothetical protein [Akkermansiaceae bacterium]
TYSTEDDLAAAGSDYVGVTDAPFSFEAGETGKTVSVTIIGDTDPEENETFKVVLSLADGGPVSLAKREGVGTICNDDFLVPVIVGPGSVEGLVAEELETAVDSRNTPTSFSLSGAPRGMRIDETGLIRWVPAAVGSYSVEVTARNPAGSASAPVTFEVGPNPLVEALEGSPGIILRTGGTAPWGHDASADSV